MKRICLVAIMLFCFISLVFALPGVKRWRLAWDPNAEADLAGYKVYYGITSGDYGFVVDVGNVTQWDIPPDLNEQYFFVLTAYDTSGNESDFSNEVNHFFDQTAPGVPVGLILEEIQ